MVSRYRKRNSKNDGYEVLAWLLTIGFTLTVGILIGVFKLLSSLIKWIIGLFKEKNNKNSIKNQSTTKPKKINYYIDKGPITTYEDKIIKVPNRTIETPYDKLFKPQIRLRGINYFNDKKVNNYKINGQTCSADIVGTDNYKASITFYKNKNIKKATCTCPYFLKDNEYCKHIYALLLEYCSDEKIKGFVITETYKEIKQKETKINNNFYNRMMDICNSMKEILNNTKEFYDLYELKDDINIKEIYNQILAYKSKIDLYENTKLIELNEEIIELAKNDLYELENLYDSLSIECEKTFSKPCENARLEQEKIPFKGALVYHLMSENQRKKEQNLFEQQQNEELKDIWNLSPDEIKLVKSGNYEPYQFDEEELEEDDYYYEDDK